VILKLRPLLITLPMACPMNLIPRKYETMYHAIFDRRYYSELKRLERQSTVNAATSYDYAGAIQDYRFQCSAPLRRYKEKVLQWFVSVMEKHNNTYCVLLESGLRKVIYVDRETAAPYFSIDEYGQLFNRLFETPIRSSIQLIGKRGDSVLCFKPKILKDHLNNLLHSFVEQLSDIDCNSYIVEVRSMYFSEKDLPASNINYGMIHYYVSQNPYKDPTTNERESYEGRDRPFYLLHIEDFCDCSSEGLPREYYCPPMTHQIIHQWTTQLTNTSFCSVGMATPRGWISLNLNQKRYAEGTYHRQKCLNKMKLKSRISKENDQTRLCQNYLYFPEGHKIVRCSLCGQTNKRRDMPKKQKQRPPLKRRKLTY